MKLGIASDHRGYLKKQKLLNFLKKKGYNVVDYGTDNSESVDFPDYAFKVSQDVASKKLDYGILICSNGIGMSIAANKVKKIRCAKVSTVKEAIYSRKDNDCNVLAISNNQSLFKLKKIITTFIHSPFANEEKYIRRIGKLDNYEH